MVRWTEHALVQLRHIHDYIVNDSAFYAKRVSEAIVKTTIQLDDLPRKGRKVAELNNDNIREVSLYSYRIIYEIKLKDIDVLAIIHKRQNFTSDDLVS